MKFQERMFQSQLLTSLKISSYHHTYYCRSFPPPARYRLEPMLKFHVVFYVEIQAKKVKSYRLPSLKLTASLPLQVNGWKMNFLLEYLLWRGRVSFRSVHFNHLSVQSTIHQDIAHLLVISQGNWFTQAAM